MIDDKLKFFILDSLISQLLSYFNFKMTRFQLKT